MRLDNVGVLSLFLQSSAWEKLAAVALQQMSLLSHISGILNEGLLHTLSCAGQLFRDPQDSQWPVFGSSFALS